MGSLGGKKGEMAGEGKGKGCIINGEGRKGGRGVKFIETDKVIIPSERGDFTFSNVSLNIIICYKRFEAR